MNSSVNNSIKISGVTDVMDVSLVNFKEFCIDTNLVLPDLNADIDQIVSITLNVNIDNSYIRKCTQVTSIEGQIMTGKLLIVSGDLKQNVEYIDDHLTHSIHGIQFNIPFSTYVVLPTNIDENKNVVVKGYIEDVYVKKTDFITFYENIIMLLNLEFI